MLFYKDIAEDVKKRFDISNYEFERPLLKEKKQKVIGLMRDELTGKIFKEFLGLRAKTYSYLTDDNGKSEKKKSYKKMCNKKKAEIWT